MRTFAYLSPIVFALAVAMGCSNMNGCLGTSSNNAPPTDCGPGTVRQLQNDGSYACVLSNSNTNH